MVPTHGRVGVPREGQLVGLVLGIETNRMELEQMGLAEVEGEKVG